MTRETALRRMLAGKKVEHPELPIYYFMYVASLQIPVIRCSKINDEILGQSQGCILPFGKGWKEYKVEK